jgi:hypothetical protein
MRSSASRAEWQTPREGAIPILDPAYCASMSSLHFRALSATIFSHAYSLGPLSPCPLPQAPQNLRSLSTDIVEGDRLRWEKEFQLVVRSSKAVHHAEVRSSTPAHTVKSSGRRGTIVHVIAALG